MLYAQSWALVHYLIHGSDERRGQLNRYAELRRAGKPDEEALKEAFGDIVALERELASYVRRYMFRSLRYTAALDAATGPVTARALSLAESLGLRAGFYVATRRDAEAAALAAEALKAEPSAPAPHEALALAAWRGGRSDEALAELEKAVTSPEATDFAHYLHGRLLWSSAAGGSSLDRVEASLRRAVDLNPQFAEAHESLALVKAENGAPVDQTLPLAVRACVLEPTEIRYRITALRLGAHGGAVVEARAKARELLAWARGEEQKQVEALLEELSDPRRLPPEAACAGGHAPSCHELGLRHRHGAGVPKDPVRAAAFFKKACEAGEPNACASLGWAYEEGSGVARDLTLAVPLYRRAAAAVLQKSCDSDDPTACTMLGSMLRVGQGIPVDLARAESLLQRACDEGSGWGCGELGSLLLGRGTPETRRRAAALYEKGCGGDSPGSCAFLAQMLETGDGVRRDAARAKTLYRKACEGGYAPACPKAGPAP
jgi:TPR repeat protein